MTCNILINRKAGDCITTDVTNISHFFSGLKINSDSHALNKLTLYEGTHFNSCTLNINDGSEIEIGRSRYGINNLTVHANGGIIKIGSDFSCWGVNLRVQEKGSKITIGNDCMFSSDILIYATDIHGIIDLKSNEVINRARPVVIGDHVWIGRRVCILKGVCLSENTIVGMGSVVTKSFENGNISIAGNPAEIIKKDVTWTRRHVDSFFAE